METVYFRLKPVLKERMEAAGFGIHHNHGNGNAFAAEDGAFVGYGYGKVVATLVLQGFGQFVRACAVSGSFYHCNDFSFRLEQ